MQNELPEADLRDVEYLSMNFPACMSREDLARSIKENDGVVGNKSRSALVKELEMIVLFHIRGESHMNGYIQLFHTPEEIVEEQCGSNPGKWRQALRRRGVGCPKWVRRRKLRRREDYQQKKLLISVLKKELGEKVRQAFSTVVELELLYYHQQEERAAEGQESKPKFKERGSEHGVESESDESPSDSLSVSSFDSSSKNSFDSSSPSSLDSSSKGSFGSLSNSSSDQPSHGSSRKSLLTGARSESEESCDSGRSELTAQFLCLYERVHSLGAFPVSNKHPIEVQ